MSNDQKRQFFRHLVQLGFKEIEVSYPAASDIDFAFCQELRDGGEVPDDVWIQVCRLCTTGGSAERLGAHAGTGRPDPENVRGGRGAQERHHPHVQCDLVSLPRSGVQR